MQIEFSCPQCGLTMQASVESSGGTAECPQCGNQFVVEADIPQVQVVKARAVPAPGQQPPHAHGHPPAQGHAFPQPQAHGHAPQHSHSPRGHAGHPAPVSPAVFAARAQAAEAAKQSRRLFTGLGIAAVLLVSVVVWLNVHGKKVTQAPPPAVTDAGALDIAVPAPKADSPEELEKKRIAEELEKTKAALAKKNSEEDVKAKELANQRQALREEAYVQDDEEAREFRDYLKSVFFNGDAAATDAYLKVWDDVMWGVSNLMTDNDKSNDLKSREEFEAYVTERLMTRIEKSEVLNAWLKKSNREPRKLIGELAMVDPKNPRSTATGSAAGKKFNFSKYASMGSGFWISADGWILSNEHVVGDAKVVDLHVAEDKIIEAKVIKIDMGMDLALLKADYKPAAWLAVSKGAVDLQLGRPVFTVGYPNPTVQGVEPKYTDGKISSTSGIGDRKDSYQISVPVQHGNSGGALVDAETGWVVGVVNAKLVSGDNVSYAIKGNVVSGFFESVPEAKTAAAKQAPKAITKGNGQEAIARATKASVLILRKR